MLKLCSRQRWRLVLMWVSSDQETLDFFIIIVSILRIVVPGNWCDHDVDLDLTMHQLKIFDPSRTWEEQSKMRASSYFKFVDRSNFEGGMITDSEASSCVITGTCGTSISFLLCCPDIHAPLEDTPALWSTTIFVRVQVPLYHDIFKFGRDWLGWSQVVLVVLRVPLNPYLVTYP